MADLDPQVQIKLMEISKEWTKETTTFTESDAKRKHYLENFDNIYKKLAKTVSEAMLEE